MDDFALFTTRPQGNSAPMASSRSASTSASTTRSGFHDVFSIPNQNPAPMYDKPVYDDDVFDMRSSAKVGDDLFGSLGGRKKRSEEEELIPGFGSPARRRELPETNQQKSAGPSANHSTMPEDPFVVLETNSSGVFTDPLEHLGRPVSSGSVNIDPSSSSGGIFEDDDAFDGIAKSVPAFTSNKNNENLKERSPVESFENVGPKTRPKSFDSRSSVKSPNSNYSPYADQSPKTSEHLDAADEVWLNVSEIPLFTQPSTAPPPSRRPPPVVIKSASVGKAGSRRRDSEVYSGARQSYPRSKNSATRTSASPIDELEDFAMGKPQTNERANIFSNEEDIETKYAAAASAAAMKDAMDKAEAKFKHAKEVRERDARSARNREFPQQENDLDDLEDRERQEKIEREDREREQMRRQREKAEIEREKAKQAVERATREARERAAAEARTRAERAAVERVNAEARQRAERAAVQRAASEARERAAVDARERAERAAVEARERAASEARIRAERAAAAAREKQHKAENDLESFFGMGPSRANSAPKQRATTSENVIDTQAQSRGSADGPRWASSNSPSSIRKAATTIVDDLSSIFGGASSSGEFQEVEGETEERRRARLERHQRTLERAAKALAEKNERDMQTQRDQAERHRISETLDYEIKRWAAGKESNLRALLSTLQYVLWPECGWQPVSLTDLITAAHVKKAYRKATLCIHPDKVQQKGANLQQKYIAEKVFDLLKEAWNKFNSEELF